MAEVMKVSTQGVPLVLSFMDRDGRIATAQVAGEFGMSEAQLAETAGIAEETL